MSFTFWRHLINLQPARELHFRRAVPKASLELEDFLHEAPSRSLCLALAIVCAGPGCDSKKADGGPSPVSQEATKKSLQASGDFYKQQHQTKK